MAGLRQSYIEAGYGDTPAHHSEARDRGLEVSQQSTGSRNRYDPVPERANGTVPCHFSRDSK